MEERQSEMREEGALVLPLRRKNKETTRGRGNVSRTEEQIYGVKKSQIYNMVLGRNSIKKKTHEKGKMILVMCKRRRHMGNVPGDGYY